MDSNEPITDAELARLCRNAALAYDVSAGACAEHAHTQTKESFVRFNAAKGALELAEERLFQALRILSLEQIEKGA